MIPGHPELLLPDGHHQLLLGLNALAAIPHQHALISTSVWLDLAQGSTECHLMLPLLCLHVELAEDGVLGDILCSPQALTHVEEACLPTTNIERAQ